MSYNFFETQGKPYQECSNPNDPEDKSLCLIVQDGSKFEGAIVRYTTFKLVEQELTGDDIACQYEYEIEVPPHDIKQKITAGEGKEFEKKLGEWVIEILQKQMDKHAAADRDTNT
jgi:bacillopeptidase F (M6 metalloprotease family)